MGYRVINGRIQFIGDFGGSLIKDSNKSNHKNKQEVNFNKVLQNTINKKNKEEFTISNHALDRLRQRNICFNEVDMKNINEGINKAEKRYCKEVVILYKDVALVTSVKNRTVITAVSKEENQENVFTNIDGLVIL